MGDTIELLPSMEEADMFSPNALKVLEARYLRRDDAGKIVEDTTKNEFFGTPRSERAQLFLSKILGH